MQPRIGSSRPALDFSPASFRPSKQAARSAASTTSRCTHPVESQLPMNEVADCSSGSPHTLAASRRTVVLPVVVRFHQSMMKFGIRKNRNNGGRKARIARSVLAETQQPFWRPRSTLQASLCRMHRIGDLVIADAVAANTIEETSRASQPCTRPKFPFGRISLRPQRNPSSPSFPCQPRWDAECVVGIRE